MKLGVYNTSVMGFKGRREDRNTVQQLKQDNNYSLTENNKIRISNAINNLADESGESNIKFLLDVADNLKYGTNIDLGKEPANNWKSKLHNAAIKSLSVSDPITQKKYAPELDRVFRTKKELNDDEKSILNSRSNILSKLDLSQLEDEKNPNIKRVESNLDYFIVSADTPTKQKKYILNRFDYFLSPDYKINPQLEDKKTKVFAEMINDLVVDTKESRVPNTKAINQKHHGMCAAISIARKLTSYEDKPNYVDSLLSELDDSPNIMVYDKMQIGKGVKVPVKKTYVDFNDAEKKGYRIVDASTTQWMNIGGMYDSTSVQKSYYVPFDRENFGVNSDERYVIPTDKNIATKQQYYQALLKSKEAIGAAKKMQLSKNLNAVEHRQNRDKDLLYLQKINSLIKSDISNVVPGISDKEAHNTLDKLVNLRKNTSSDIDKIKDNSKKYYFIPNEESVMKERKVKAFLSDTFKDRVNSEELEKTAPQIRELIEESAATQSRLNPHSSQSANVSKNRRLYEAAAAYRNQVNVSLNDADYLTDKMIKYDVPDQDTLLSQNMEKVIKYVDKTGDEDYINHFSNILGIEPQKEDVVGALIELKAGVDSILTDGLDFVYSSLGFENRQDFLLSDISGLKQDIEAGDKETIKDSSFMLGFENPDKNRVLKEYNKFEDTLLKGVDNKQYTEIYNKIGNKNQLQSCAGVYNIVLGAFLNPNDEISAGIIQNFNTANGLSDITPIEESKAKLMEVGKAFNNMSANIAFVRQIMNVQDKYGNTLNSPNPQDAVMEKMEKNGEVIPAKDLIPLRNRFDKIDKLRSQDEFSSRQGKISDPALYKFSQPEKETLKKISKSINQMYSEVNKETAFVLGEIRKPLEDSSRKTGVATGHYWVFQKTGGMSSEQEVKILQQMTDRRYQSTLDLDKAVDKIKNTPYSGISGTSVFHNRMGAHAQYVAEVSELNGKDVLYHDNTWGASELENTWTDSEGVLHTDYSDSRGGATGYITNDKYRNGNYVDDLKYKTGYVAPNHIENKQLRKLSGETNGYKFATLFDMIVPGTDGSIKRTAASIKDNIFVSPSAYLDNFTALAANMTQDEIKSSIDRCKKAGSDYSRKYSKMVKRLDSTPFSKGIDSKADYDALPANDPIKVNFEKAALVRSFPGGVNWKKLAKANSVSEVKEFEKERDNKARSYFNYAFAKEPEILNSYIMNKNVNKLDNIISSALDKYDIKLEDAQKQQIIKKSIVYDKNDKSQFDGSLKHTIDFAVNKTLKTFDEVVPDSDKAQSAKEDIRENLTKSLSDALYFNDADINNTSTKFKAISKYIDKKYNPETNFDFAEIYRRMQDMTTEEFNKETLDVTHEDLAIKDYTGYEMLRRFKASDEKTESTVRNVVFQQELLKDIKLSETDPSYKYHKLYKHEQGATYRGNRTFDDLYRDYYFSLQVLGYEKMFNKHKDEALRNYGATPAYPKVDVIDKKKIDEQCESITNATLKVLESVNLKKNTLRVYDIHDELSSVIGNLPDSGKLSTKQVKNISNLAGQFVTLTYGDSSSKSVNDAAMNLLELDKNATGMDYKNTFSDLDKQMQGLKKLNTEQDLKDSIKDDAASLKILFNSILMNIPKRYQNTLREDINTWMKEELKSGDMRRDNIARMNTLSSNIDKYSIPKKNYDVTKKDYLNGLNENIMSMKQVKTVFDDNKFLKEQSSKACTAALTDVLGMIPDDKKADFADSMHNLINSEVELKKADINKVLSGVVNPQDKTVKKLSNTIQVLNKSNILDKKLKNNIDKTLSDIDKSTNLFVKGNIKPEYQQAIVASVNDTVKFAMKNSNKYNEENAAVAQDKFLNDYKKYHMLNYPLELLNDYLFLSAKDGPLNSSNKSAVTKAETEFDLKRASLESAMEVASLVDMQDTLMEAISTGNAAAVAEKFSDFDVPLGFANDKSKGMLSMDNELAIDYIVRNLVVGSNDETAVMFINQLGLADKFLKGQNKIFDTEKTKKDVDRMVSILGTTNKEAGIVNNAIKVLTDDAFDNDANFNQKIDDAKKDIIQKTDKMGRKNDVKTYLGALDTAKAVINANPDLPKSVVVAQCMNKAMADVGESANTDIAKIQAKLNLIPLMYNLINKLDIPEYSEAHKELEIYKDKFKTFQEYNNARLGAALKNNTQSMQVTYVDE